MSRPMPDISFVSENYPSIQPISCQRTSKQFRKTVSISSCLKTGSVLRCFQAFRKLQLLFSSKTDLVVRWSKKADSEIGRNGRDYPRNHQKADFHNLSVFVECEKTYVNLAMLYHWNNCKSYGNFLKFLDIASLELLLSKSGVETRTSF